MGHENHLPQLPPLLESANAEMARAIATARQVAASDVAVLLSGESATGKHVLAAAIHGWSARCAGPFVVVPRVLRAEPRSETTSLALLDDAGSRHNWLTAADSGTLFFDEVCELPAVQQAKLARFLDEHRFEVGSGTEPVTVDVRVLAATTRDLEAEVRAGRFREDLFFRLNVVHISLPPLRERVEDLPRLTAHLLASLAARHARGALRFAPEVQHVFARYPWPGNVRELLSILERLVVLSRGEMITTEDLPERLLTPPKPIAPVSTAPPPLRELERHQIEVAIRQSHTLQEAALRLGIDPTTLWRKRKRYGLA
jgi:NtrC-family two-component system response regulator AlgB